MLLTKQSIMENKELYPELADYIFNYCGKYFWRKVNFAPGKVLATAIENEISNILMYKVLTEGGEILSDKNIGELTNDGYEAYKLRISERIFNEHKDELELNLCLKCNKIARTPYAKQCRFCFHNWR
jgi:ribosomal protein L40E